MGKFFTGSRALATVVLLTACVVAGVHREQTTTKEVATLFFVAHIFFNKTDSKCVPANEKISQN